jgi:mannose-6-phosphate isomerase-like protein (cupin superfamily)
LGIAEPLGLRHFCKVNPNSYLIRSTTSTEGAFNVLGDSQKLLLASADTSGAFALIEQENPSGFEIPLNVHDAHEETNFIISGEVLFVIGPDSLTLRPGDCLHIRRGTPHRFRVIGATSARMLLMFHPAGLENLFRELDAKFPPGSLPKLDDLNVICAPYRTRVIEL